MSCFVMDLTAADGERADSDYKISGHVLALF